MLSYAERVEKCHNATGKNLLKLIEKKRTNLAIAADVANKAELLHLAKTVGPYICVFKTHIDIIDDYDPSLPLELQKIAEEHQFQLFEDRKFADIGNTVERQYGGGIYKIASWAHLVNAHVLPGPGIIQGLKKVGHPLGRGLLLLAEMSSAGSLATGSYTKTTEEMAKENSDFVMGFICQKKVSEDPGFIHFTPGVNLETKGDTLGQQYNTPHHAICVNQTDVIIVGRGITHAKNPIIEAERYRAAGWHAYQNQF